MPWLAWIAAALIWLTFSGAPPVCVRALRESLAAEDAARAGNSEEKQAALTVLPRRDDPDRVRKRRLWIGIAAGVVTLAAGVTISLIATRDDDDGRPAPNSGVTIEAFAWR